MHHYPFHVGDYIRATAHLDIVEDCVYRRLIDLYMETEEPIPNETQQVIRRLRLGSSGLILETILKEFFTLEADNCWHNSRCDAEILAYKRLADVSRINGKLGGRPKKTQQVILDNPTGTQQQPSGLQPRTKNQEPRTNSREPLTNNQEDSKPNNKVKTLPGEPGQKNHVVDAELQAASKATWQGYGQAYFARYGTEPVRNAKVSSMIKLFVQRIGMNEAPLVAGFYVSHNEKFYVQKAHPVDLMLKDAEGLRTQWATRQSMTSTRAGQIDKSQANFSAVGEAMKILEGKNNAKNT